MSGDLDPFWIEVEGEDTIDGFVELGSDDSVQVKIDDCEVFAANVSRGCGASGDAQNCWCLIFDNTWTERNIF